MPDFRLETKNIFGKRKVTVVAMIKESCRSVTENIIIEIGRI